GAAHPHTGVDAVAGVGLGADGPLGADRLPLVLLAHRGIVFESAGSQDHTAPGADRLLFSVPLDGDTGYPAVLGDEVDDGGAQPHGHTRAAQSRTQATRECLAHGQLDAFALREPRQPARPEFRQLPSTLRVA